jgi:hypothetical protein
MQEQRWACSPWARPSLGRLTEPCEFALRVNVEQSPSTSPSGTLAFSPRASHGPAERPQCSPAAGMASPMTRDNRAQAARQRGAVAQSSRGSRARGGLLGSLKLTSGPITASVADSGPAATSKNDSQSDRLNCSETAGIRFLAAKRSPRSALAPVRGAGRLPPTKTRLRHQGPFLSETATFTQKPG